MPPLLGTKTSSAPVGDKSGGGRRAARSLLSCALWRGMGRLWRGMGGMGRPELLSAHRPHQQQGLSGFQETRDPRPGYCQAYGKCQREFRGFYETRITKHESRLLSPHGRCFPARCGATAAPLWRGYGAAVARVGRLWRWSGMGGLGAAWAAYCPRASVPAPVSLSRSASRRAPLAGQLPLPRTPSEPMLKKENILHGAISGAFHIASKPNLHFSPRGEAKCVRGPSGRGASRLARAGVLEPYIEHGKQAQRSHGGHTACFDRRVVRHAGGPLPGFHESRDTKHESRPFFACFDRRVVRNAG